MELIIGLGAGFVSTAALSVMWWFAERAVAQGKAADDRVLTRRR
jgi:hypothetical protein